MYILSGDGFDTDSRKTIMDKLNEDKRNFILNGDKLGTSSCRLLIGEIQRDPKKDDSDDNIEKILRNVRSMTMKNPIVDHFLIELINTYIPPHISDNEIKLWMENQNYNDETIAVMGKSAYRIIGEAQRHFIDRDINSDYIKNIIEGVINDSV